VNILPKDKQAAVIAALCEWVSIRATGRLHDVHKDSVMRLGMKVGHGCTAIHTSYIERQNLTLRQSQRRLTRLSNGWSKKFEAHCAAIALYATHYNFCRVHETLRITPAMHLGVTDHVWTISELIEAALSNGAQMQVKRALGSFRVINGGKHV